MADARLPRGVRSRTTSLVAILISRSRWRRFSRSRRGTPRIAPRHRRASDSRLREVRRVGVFGQREGSAVLDARVGVQPHRDARRPRPRASRCPARRSSITRNPHTFFARATRRAISSASTCATARSSRAARSPRRPCGPGCSTRSRRTRRPTSRTGSYEVVSGTRRCDSLAPSCISSSGIGRAVPAVAYGFELCFAQFAADGLKKVMAKYAILPPSLTGGVPNDSVSNDSIFSARVFDGGGHVIFQSEVQYPDDVHRLLQARLLRWPQERDRAPSDAGEVAAHRRAAERATAAAARRPGD